MLPGRGRPRKNGEPKKSDRLVPSHLGRFPSVSDASTANSTPRHGDGQLPMPQGLVPATPLIPMPPGVQSMGRFAEIITRPDFIDEVHHWDCHTSAKRWSEKTGLSKACVRRYAQMISPFYKSLAAQKLGGTSSQEHSHGLLEAPKQTSQMTGSEEDEDDPFGLGISLGWSRDEDGDSDNANPFSFSRVDGKPMNPFPSSPLATCSDHLHIYADRCLVICDLHCPAHDPALLFAACKFASQKMGARKVILGGDFLDMGSLSSYTQTGHRRRLIDDVDVLRKILGIMRSQFSLEPICILGNHEQRWNRIMDPDVSADEFLRLAFTDVQVSRYEWCSLTSGDKEWHVDHGTGGSNPVLHGNRLAARLHKNVLLGHMHKSHDTRDYSGRFQVLASGTCCDPTRIRYVSERIQASAWVQGVTVIQDGFGRVLGPQSPELRDA